MSPTYYEVLHIGPDADPASVKAAYRSRMKQIHPDKGGSTAEAIAVARAYQILADEQRRARYDRELASRRGLGRFGARDVGPEHPGAAEDPASWVRTPVPAGGLLHNSVRLALALSLTAGYLLAAFH